ncbi:hypothetical protein [Kosakonia quasisacchari]|uniref:hypothetical protein n=1 Tax=Kosakonia quasisacchari TaxID=2529380 RepID=UPI0039E0B0D4
MLKKCKIIAGFAFSPFRLHATSTYKINTIRSAEQLRVDALRPGLVKIREEAISAKIVQTRMRVNQTVSKEIERNQRQLRAPVPWRRVIAERKYPRQKRQANSETLSSDYREHPYACFTINTSQVCPMPDIKSLNITKGERDQATNTVINSALIQHRLDGETREGKTYGGATNAHVEMEIRTLSGKYDDTRQQGNTQRESAVSQNARRERTGYFEPAENPISPNLVVKIRFTKPQNVTPGRFSLSVIAQVARCIPCYRSFSRRLSPVKNRMAITANSFSLISAKPANRIKPAPLHLCDTLRAPQQAISTNAIITVCN